MMASIFRSYDRLNECYRLIETVTATRAGFEVSLLANFSVQCGRSGSAKRLAPESANNDADDGSANRSHADDGAVGLRDDRVGDAK